MARAFLTILKFILTVLLIPALLAMLGVFKSKFNAYPLAMTDFFMYGFIAYLLVFIFINHLTVLYESGQIACAAIFFYLAGASQMVAKFLPFYPVVLTGLLAVTRWLLKSAKFDDYFMFFIGFFWGLHMVLTAKSLQDSEPSAIKIPYLFWMILIVLFQCCLFVVLFDFLKGEWTVVSFVKQFWHDCVGRYEWIINEYFKQLRH